jgi:lipopolysaccharide biosynthesis glycosyltransferase
MNKIHVACCFDDKMAIPASVVAASVAATTKDAHVTFYMLHAPLLSVKIDDLKRKLDSDLFSLVDCTVTESLSNLYNTNQYSEAMYYRFLLPYFVKSDRVIYLDSDTMVRKSLASLYATDLEGRPIAAVQDYGLTYHMRDHGIPVAYDGGYIAIDEYYSKILGFELSETAYFNNGVLVMDLDMWKETQLSERCIDFCRQNPGLIMADQDAANRVLVGDFTKLDARWNSFSYLYREYFPDKNKPRRQIFGGYEKNFLPPTGEWLEILRKWADDPWIVHFSFQSKPWVWHHRRTDYDREYWDNAFRTPFGARLHREFLISRGRSYWNDTRNAIVSRLGGHFPLRQVRDVVRWTRRRRVPGA